MAASHLEFRRSDWNRRDNGLELRGGAALTWRKGPFYVTSTEATALRIFDRRSYSLSILQNGGHAGLSLGPVDFGAGMALSLLNIDYLKHDLSFGMASPRSLVQMRVAVGPVRLGVPAHVEYLWRWFGRDYWVRGAGVTLDIESPSFRGPRAREAK